MSFFNLNAQTVCFVENQVATKLKLINTDFFLILNKYYKLISFCTLGHLFQSFSKMNRVVLWKIIGNLVHTAKILYLNTKMLVFGNTCGETVFTFK